MELRPEMNKFLEVLEKNLGNVSFSLSETGYDRQDFDDWMENMIFRIRVNEIDEKCIDYVESRLIQEINKGNLNAIQFYLKTKGKNRGYV